MLGVYRIKFRTTMAQAMGEGKGFTQLKIVYTAREMV